MQAHRKMVGISIDTVFFEKSENFSQSVSKNNLENKKNTIPYIFITPVFIKQRLLLYSYQPFCSDKQEL